jgi:hypothetical protein
LGEPLARELPGQFTLPLCEPEQGKLVIHRRIAGLYAQGALRGGNGGVQIAATARTIGTGEQRIHGVIGTARRDVALVYRNTRIGKPRLSLTNDGQQTARMRLLRYVRQLCVVKATMCCEVINSGVSSSLDEFTRFK